MLESWKSLGMAAALVFLPVSLGALPPEERWCTGGSCKCCNLVVHTPVPEGQRSNLVFTFELEFEQIIFEPGARLKFVRGTSLGGPVFDFVATGNLSGGADLTVEYQIGPSIVSALAIGPLPTGRETIEVSRELVGMNGRITVTRGGFSTYSTGRVPMSGLPEAIDQGVLELVGEVKGYMIMTHVEID